MPGVALAGRRGVEDAAADRKEPLKLGGGRDTPYDTALRAAMHLSGGFDLADAIKSGRQVVPALQRGDTQTGIGAALSAAASGAMVLGGIVTPEGKAAEAARTKPCSATSMSIGRWSDPFPSKQIALLQNFRDASGDRAGERAAA